MVDLTRLTPQSPLDFSPPARPRATVLVTGYRQAPHLLDCLRSLALRPPSTHFELKIFLNEPTPSLTEQIGQMVSGVDLLTSPVNVGFAGACNGAAAGIESDYLVLLNDDAVAEPGWLDRLVEAADADPEAGAVGGKILSPEGAPREDGTVLWSDGTVTLVDDYSIARPAPPPVVRWADYCSAASLLVRRMAWEEVGGFDEGYYPAYYEDVDLCLKLQDRGWHVLYQPASVIRHRQGSSTSLRYRQFLRDRNKERLCARWPRALADRPPPARHDPRAIAQAMRRAGERLPSVGQGPRAPDEHPPAAPDDEAWYRERQQEIERAFTAVLETDRRNAPRWWWTRAADAGVAGFKQLLRHHWPAAHRALARRTTGWSPPS